jgi:hypothetical protein
LFSASNEVSCGPRMENRMQRANPVSVICLLSPCAGPAPDEPGFPFRAFQVHACLNSE